MREKENLTLLGNQQTEYSMDYNPSVLEAFQNKHPENDYFVKFNCPEFTSLCPITGQAHGLCFSVQPGVQPPPSLQNIFKELQSDLGIVPPKDGTLTKWAERGVLMLNTTLTVRRGQANSHKNLGWTTFTDHIIEKLNEHEQPIVFLLWGGNARSKKKLITAPQHLVLESVHPSPLSAYNGFFGCKHFSKCNAFLEAHGIDPIDWDLNH